METIELGSKTKLHYIWQIQPVGLVDIKTVKDAYDYCESMSKGSESPAHFMTAVLVMYNAMAEHYNSRIDESIESFKHFIKEEDKIDG